VDPFPYGGRTGLPPDPRSNGARFDPNYYLRNQPVPMPNDQILALYGLAPPVNQVKAGS
jgi:hypothetical protein